MKKISYFALLTVLCAFSLSFTGCKSDDGGDTPAPDLEKDALSTLVGSWEAVSVTKDDASYDEGYEGFTLIITEDKKFQTDGDPNQVFPVGTFQFVAETDYKKVTCDGVEMNLAVNGNNLVVDFTRIDEDSDAARILGIAGDYRFTLKAIEE